MTLGDALFARLAIKGFADIGSRIGGLQARVASGVNDPRASADPARAIELSALRDIRARLGTQDGIGRAAADRLALTDQTLAGVSDNLRQLKEITLRAANDTLTAEAHAALRTEAVTIRTALLAAANSGDMAGRPLFAGAAPGPAFAVSGADGLAYRGDDQSPTAQIGDAMRIATGLPGSRVFGTGADSIFALVDDTISALTEPMLSARSEARAPGPARLELERTRDGTMLDVTLTGPAGAARVALDLRLDAPLAPVDAINAVSAETGITASLAADGRGILLTAAGVVALSGQSGGTAARPAMTLGPAAPEGAPGGPATALRPARMTADAMIDRASQAVAHMATMRAAAGSLAEAVDRQLEANSARRLTVDQAVAGIEDLDVAATLTRLQSLLLTQQASQQTFVKIAGQSLFSYLR